MYILHATVSKSLFKEVDISKKSCTLPITLESCQTGQCEVAGPGLSDRKTEIRKHSQLRFSDQG